MRVKDFERWLTPAEAGRAVGVTKQTIQRWAEDGRIRAVKTHQGWLVDPEDADKHASERERP